MNSLRDVLTKCIVNCNFLITETEVNNFVEKILLTSTIHYQNDGSVLKLEGGINDIGIPKEKWDLALKMPKYLAFSMSSLDPINFTRYCKLIGYSSFSDMEYDLMRGCISGFEPNPYEIILINGNVQAYMRKELDGFNFHPYYIQWLGIKPYRLQYKDGDNTEIIEFQSLEDIRTYLETFEIPVDGEIHEVEIWCMQDIVPINFVIVDTIWDSRIPGPGGKIIQINID